MSMKYIKKNTSKHSGSTKHSKSNDTQQDSSKSNEDEVNVIKRARDEEIKACFDGAKQNLDGLLKSKKEVIQDLALELERLGRRREDIAAEIVHEQRNCEELSKSQIYSYLDDKYKDQTQAQRRKGKKKESNANTFTNLVPKTGTESLPRRMVTLRNDGQQTTTSNEYDTPPEQERTEQSAGTDNNINASESSSRITSPTPPQSIDADMKLNPSDGAANGASIVATVDISEPEAESQNGPSLGNHEFGEGAGKEGFTGLLPSNQYEELLKEIQQATYNKSEFLYLTFDKDNLFLHVRPGSREGVGGSHYNVLQ
jgi:hypothetical protein